MDCNLKQSRIFIHALELKLRPFEVSPYVCIGSHAFAMFKNYGCAGYVDDPLSNTVCIYGYFDACLHCIALLCIQLDYVVALFLYEHSEWIAPANLNEVEF